MTLYGTLARQLGLSDTKLILWCWLSEESCCFSPYELTDLAEERTERESPTCYFKSTGGQGRRARTLIFWLQFPGMKIPSTFLSSTLEEQKKRQQPNTLCWLLHWAQHVVELDSGSRYLWSIDMINKEDNFNIKSYYKWGKGEAENQQQLPAHLPQTS